MANSATVEDGPKIALADIEQAIENGREKIERQTQVISQLGWPLVRQRLAVIIRDEVGNDLVAWIAEAWGTAEDLRKFKDTEAYPAGTDAFYDMLPHSIEGVVRPRISIRSAGAEIASVTFDVTVIADFHCVALIIRDAHIVGFGGGEFGITLTISHDGEDLSGPIELARSRVAVQCLFTRRIPIF